MTEKEELESLREENKRLRELVEKTMKLLEQFNQLCDKQTEQIKKLEEIANMALDHKGKARTWGKII